MTDSHRELARAAINTPHLVFFVVAAAAPLTALGTNSPIAIAFGGPGAAGAFVVVGIVLALFAAGFTAMSLFIRNAGAFYAYITQGLGRPFGLGAAFLAVLSYNSIQISLYGAFAVFMQSVLRDFAGIVVPWPALVLGAIATVTVLGYRSITLSANILGVALAAECAILAVVAGAIVLNGGGANGLTVAPLAPSSLLTPGMGAMFAFTFLSFIGFEATAIFSEEAVTPEKTIPRATYIAVAFLALFYAFVVWAVVDGFGLQGAVEVAKKDPTGMYFLAAESFVGPWAKAAMEIFMLTSLFAVLLAFHNAVARYQYSLAREGILPAIFSRTHPVHRSPWISSLSQSLLALLLIIPFWAGGADPFNVFYVPVTTPGIYGILILQILTALAVVAFFTRDRKGLSRWRTLFAPLLGAAGMMAILYFAIANIGLITGRTGSINVLLPLVTLLVFAAGVGVAFFLKRHHPVLYRRFGTGSAS
jgi:amino acid transporter